MPFSLSFNLHFLHPPLLPLPLSSVRVYCVYWALLPETPQRFSLRLSLLPLKPKARGCSYQCQWVKRLQAADVGIKKYSEKKNYIIMIIIKNNSLWLKGIPAVMGIHATLVAFFQLDLTFSSVLISVSHQFKMCFLTFSCLKTLELVCFSAILSTSATMKVEQTMTNL